MLSLEYKLRFNALSFTLLIPMFDLFIHEELSLCNHGDHSQYFSSVYTFSLTVFSVEDISLYFTVIFMGFMAYG